MRTMEIGRRDRFERERERGFRTRLFTLWLPLWCLICVLSCLVRKEHQPSRAEDDFLS